MVQKMMTKADWHRIATDTAGHEAALRQALRRQFAARDRDVMRTVSVIAAELTVARTGIPAPVDGDMLAIGKAARS